MANKYRREGRSATLSHDALLIALVTAAPDVQRRLQREAKVGIPPDCCLVGSCRQTSSALAERAFIPGLPSSEWKLPIHNLLVYFWEQSVWVWGM